MFGRKSKTQEPQDHPVVEARSGAKNRPTPKRRDQEAARKQPLVVTDRKAAKAAERARRGQENTAMRAAMITGDDRHLPPRDKGPVRRFVRDCIDVRYNVAEFLMPFMIVVLLLQLVRAKWVIIVFFGVYVVLLAAIIDLWFAWHTTKKRLKAKFGDDVALKGLASYAVMRATQIRRLRMPKPMVVRGQSLG